ncbi:MAG: HAD hydrolase family protein, partial [Faecalibacterium prausnitzii]|nr:HAD hydrolase family protein [Faecalibacterium prausnitzii]
VPSLAVSDAVRRFVAAGNRAFICTGRSLLDIHPKMAALPFSGMACLAGAYVKVGKAVLRDVALPPEVLACVDEVLAETGAGALLESAHGSVDVRGGTTGAHREKAPRRVADQGVVDPLVHGFHNLAVRTTIAAKLGLQVPDGTRLVLDRMLNFIAHCHNKFYSLLFHERPLRRRTLPFRLRAATCPTLPLTL